MGFVNKWTVVDMLTAFENEFQRHKPFSDTESAMYWRLCEIEGDIGKLPSADLEEVVRCCDCRFWDEGVCSLLSSDTPCDWYCANGRRLDNE